MVKSQTITIRIDDDEIELNNELIERYKSATRKQRVTKKGIEKFYKKLMDVMINNPQ